MPSSINRQSQQLSCYLAVPYNEVRNKYGRSQPFIEVKPFKRGGHGGR